MAEAHWDTERERESDGERKRCPVGAHSSEGLQSRLLERCDKTTTNPPITLSLSAVAFRSVLNVSDKKIVL